MVSPCLRARSNTRIGITVPAAWSLANCACFCSVVWYHSSGSYLACYFEKLVFCELYSLTFSVFVGKGFDIMIVCFSLCSAASSFLPARRTGSHRCPRQFALLGPGAKVKGRKPFGTLWCHQDGILNLCPSHSLAPKDGLQTITMLASRASFASRRISGGSWYQQPIPWPTNPTPWLGE